MKHVRWIKKRKALVCALVSGIVLCQMPGMTYAEEQNEYTLDQVVVTATKVPETTFNANADIAVITHDDIAKNHYHDLSEALRNVPGVTVNNFGGGVGYEQVNALYINGSPEILVLIDGVRANVNGSTLNNFPASGYSLDNIDRIEVLKGSASALYGSDAKGGVINIITRKAESNSTTVTLTGGSYGKEDYSFNNQGKSGDYSWVITGQKDLLGNYQDAHGVTVPQNLNATSGSFKLTKKINDDSDLTFSYDNYQAAFTYFDPYPMAGPATIDTGTARNADYTVTYNYKFSEDAHNQLVLYDRTHDTNYAINDPNNNLLMNLQTVGVQDQYTQKLGSAHTITTGLDIYQDKIINYADAFGDDYSGKSITNRALYLQDEWQLTGKWKLTSGIRDDDNSMFGNHVTPSVNLGYKQNDHTDYYISYKEFFVAPPQADLFFPIVDGGNPNLKPETGHTLEEGINNKFDNSLTGTFHLFQRQSTNAVGWENIPFYGNYWGQFANIGSEMAHGWDVQLNKKFNDHLNATIGYTFTIVDANAVDSANVDGMIPQGAWKVGLNYQQAKYDVALQGRGMIHMPGPAETTLIPYPSFPVNTYWVWDMALNYQVTKNTKAFIKLNNLFNQYYAEQTNVPYEMTAPYVPGQWWASPGRNYQIGVEYQF